MKYKITSKKLLFCLLAYVTIVYMRPFFTWNSYKYSNLINIIGYICIVLVIVLFFFRINRTFDFKSMGSLFILITITGYVYFVGEKSQIGSIGVLFQYILLLLTPLLCVKEKKEFFTLFRKIFAVLLIIPIVIFLLRFINFNIPYNLLADYRPTSNRVYLHYPLTIFMANIHSINIPVMRLCAFLDEPGYLGTIILLLLAGDKYDLRKRENKILFMAGLLTLSTAFYLVTIFYFFLINYNELLNNRRKKTIIVIIFLSIVLLLVLIRSGMWHKIYEILFEKLTSDDLRGSKTILQNTINANQNNILYTIFGHGYYSYVSIFSTSGYSWEMLLYDCGIAGIIITVIYILFVEKKGSYTKHEALFRIIMLASAMQRPYIITIPYVIIFIFGLSNLQNQEKGVTIST